MAAKHVSALVILGGLTLMAACSRSRNDGQIVRDVQSKLYADSNIQSRKIAVQSSHGVITLSGYANQDAERIAAARDAAQVEGVKIVMNNLQVVAQPTAPALVAATTPAPVEAAAPALEARDQKAPKPEAIHKLAQNASPSRKQTSHNHTSRRPTTSTTDSAALPYTVTDQGARTSPRSLPTSYNDNAAPASANSPSASANSVSAPTLPAPAVNPTPPPVQPVTIPSGTTISIRLIEPIDTEKSQTGSTFRASLNSPLLAESGATVIPAGSEVTGRIAEAKSAGRFAGSSQLALELTQLQVNGKSYALHTSQYTKQGNSRGKATAAKIGGGAALGALIGGLAGGGKGAAIGATVGAGAGTGVSAATKGQQIVLPAETALNFQLQDSISVVPSSGAPASNANSQAQSPTVVPDKSSDQQGATDDERPTLKRRNSDPAQPPPSR
jgi:hypothetical protein